MTGTVDELYPPASPARGLLTVRDTRTSEGAGGSIFFASGTGSEFGCIRGYQHEGGTHPLGWLSFYTRTDSGTSELEEIMSLSFDRIVDILGDLHVDGNITDSNGPVGGGQPQTPWAQNVDAWGYRLSRVGCIDILGGSTGHHWQTHPDPDLFNSGGFIQVADARLNPIPDGAGGSIWFASWAGAQCGIKSYYSSDVTSLYPRGWMLFYNRKDTNSEDMELMMSISYDGTVDVYHDLNVHGDYKHKGNVISPGGGGATAWYVNSATNPIATRAAVNFIQGTGVTITGVDNTTQNPHRVDITIQAGPPGHTFNRVDVIGAGTGGWSVYESFPIPSSSTGGTLLIRDSRTADASGGCLLFGNGVGEFAAMRAFYEESESGAYPVGHLLFLLRVGSSNANLSPVLGLNHQAGFNVYTNLNVEGDFYHQGTLIDFDSLGGGGSQTPWESDIDGDGYRLLNTSSIGVGTGAPIKTVFVNGQLQIHGFQFDGSQFRITHPFANRGVCIEMSATNFTLGITRPGTSEQNFANPDSPQIFFHTFGTTLLSCNVSLDVNGNLGVLNNINVGGTINGIDLVALEQRVTDLET